MIVRGSPVITLPVFRDARLRAWPAHERGGRAIYAPIGRALTRRYRTDAHFAQYSFPAVARRLNVSLARDPANADKIPHGVPMVAISFDVDCETSHRASGAKMSTPASDEWWQVEHGKLRELMTAHPGAFSYRTRGGYRIIYRLEEPFIVRNTTDDALWTVTYLRAVAYMWRRFGIVADPTCSEWVRLFRVPHATREGSVGPEELETVADAEAIGAWTCEPSPEDETIATTLRKQTVKPQGPRPNPTPRPGQPSTAPSPGRDARESVLGLCFERLGWLGPLATDGKRWARCPRSDLHSDGRGAGQDDSCVVYPRNDGTTLGAFKCAHAHCAMRDTRGALDDPRVRAVRNEAELELGRILRGETP